ncbi:MAG: hypothetical protein ABII12_01655 [Planctomycetota bacterium]
MKRVMCWLLCLALLPAAAWADDKDKKGEDKKGAEEKKSGELTDPIEILKKADAACKAVKAVKYDLRYEVTLDGKPQIGKYEAKAIFSGFVDGASEKSLVDVKYSEPESKEVRHVTAGGDGEMFFVMDHKEKKAYEDMDPAVVGSFGRVLQGAAMIEFLFDEPFSDEINGKSRELKGSKEIAGEGCYVVYVVYQAEQAPKTTWFFSKKDFLPRCRIDERTLRGGEKWVQKKTLSNVVADPRLDKDAFKLKLPKGYTKTDDFAP